MNKKFLAGMSFLALAGSFVACGDGEIYTMTPYDDAVKGAYVDVDIPDSSLMLTAIKDCQNDPVCRERMGASTPLPQSSSGIQSSGSVNPNPNTGVSSSSIFVPQLQSSSSMPVINPNPESSADVSQIPSGEYKLGTCAPASATIEKGGSVKWVFTANSGNTAGWKPTQFPSKSYAWSFPGASTTTGTGMAPAAVSYSASGQATATVTVSDESGLISETIACTPLQVNGDPITGCKCTAAASSIDYTTTPEAMWSVTGCTTTAAGGAISYTWDGTAGTDSYTKAFTAATAGYAPKLQAANQDNTIVDVTCESVKVTEGAEYTIKDGTDAGKVALPGPGKYNVVIGFACQNKTFYCNGSGGPVGGSVNGTPMASSWYTTASLTAADCTGSATVIVEVDAAATCGAQ